MCKKYDYQSRQMAKPKLRIQKFNMYPTWQVHKMIKTKPKSSYLQGLLRPNKDKFFGN